MSSFTTSAALLAGLWLASVAHAGEIAGLAFVNDDATLSVHRRQIRLWGIHIPRGAEECTAYGRATDCGLAAARALKQKVEGFVHCEDLGRADGLSLGRCRMAASGFERGLDLGAWLVEQGWAVALPEAPVEYQVLERIARDTGRGVWGIAGLLRRSVERGGL